MSSINPNNINGQYPVAGQDNDSQGFRDNFTNIKNNFTFAYNEINDLQQNAILKGALSGGTVNNDMNYNQLIRAQLKSTVETGNPIGSVTGATVTVSWADGHFQSFSIADDVTITAFSNWPTTTSLYAKMRLEITTTVADLMVIFPAAVSSTSAERIKGYVGAQSSSPKPIVLPTVGTYIFELSTFDAGATVTIINLTPNNNEIVQMNAPSANTVAAISANVGINTVFITPAGVGTYAGAVVTLPNITANGTKISIGANVGIAALQVLGQWLSTVSPSANVTTTLGSSGDTTVEFTYVSNDFKWYRTR